MFSSPVIPPYNITDPNFGSSLLCVYLPAGTLKWNWKFN